MRGNAWAENKKCDERRQRVCDVIGGVGEAREFGASDGSGGSDDGPDRCRSNEIVGDVGGDVGDVWKK